MLLEKENVREVQRWRNEVGMPPKCVTVVLLPGKLRADETVQNVEECFEDFGIQLTMEVLR
jgi:hypothetical protein